MTTLTNIPRLTILAPAFLLVAATQLAHAQTTQLIVGATMDVYRAGGYDDGSDGIAPAQISFTAGANQIFTFHPVQGEWACGPYPEFGPDGSMTGVCDGATHVANPVGTFSGISFTDFTCPLAGIFLEDSLPTSAPRPLRFYVSNSSEGGIQTDFTKLSPAIGQVFFIGDGRTGTDTGSIQGFIVPPTATQLYLGFVDVNGDVPGDYSNNIGRLYVEATLHPLP
jgi:hypothetical protein